MAYIETPSTKGFDMTVNSNKDYELDSLMDSIKFHVNYYQQKQQERLASFQKDTGGTLAMFQGYTPAEREVDTLIYYCRLVLDAHKNGTAKTFRARFLGHIKNKLDEAHVY